MRTLTAGGPEFTAARGPGTQFELGGLAGLDRQTAARRLASEGPNELPTSKPRSILSIALEVARQPMFVLLVAAGAVVTGSSSRSLPGSSLPLNSSTSCGSRLSTWIRHSLAG